MDRRTADWSRAQPNDLPRGGRARLIVAAVSVVLSATALVALFGAGPGHVQPRRVPVQPFGKYILLSAPGETTFSAALPHPHVGVRHAA